MSLNTAETMLITQITENAKLTEKLGDALPYAGAVVALSSGLRILCSDGSWRDSISENSNQMLKGIIQLFVSGYELSNSSIIIKGANLVIDCVWEISSALKNKDKSWGEVAIICGKKIGTDAACFFAGTICSIGGRIGASFAVDALVASELIAAGGCAATVLSTAIPIVAFGIGAYFVGKAITSWWQDSPKDKLNKLLKKYELSNNSSKDDIRKKLKTLLKKYHPDKNKGNKEATVMFIQIKNDFEEISKLKIGLDENKDRSWYNYMILLFDNLKQGGNQLLDIIKDLSKDKDDKEIIDLLYKNKLE